MKRCPLQSFYLFIYLFTRSFILIFISTASAPHWGLQHPNPCCLPVFYTAVLQPWDGRLAVSGHTAYTVCSSAHTIVQGLCQFSWPGILITPPADSYLVSQRNLTLLASCETDTHHEHTDLFVTQFASKISVIPWPSHLRCKIGMNNRTHPPGFCSLLTAHHWGINPEKLASF